MRGSRATVGVNTALYDTRNAGGLYTPGRFLLRYCDGSGDQSDAPTPPHPGLGS